MIPKGHAVSKGHNTGGSNQQLPLLHPSLVFSIGQAMLHTHTHTHTHVQSHTCKLQRGTPYNQPINGINHSQSPPSHSTVTTEGGYGGSIVGGEVLVNISLNDGGLPRP